MKYKIALLFQLFIFASIPANSQKPIVHNTVLIKQDSSYLLFCTGWGISMLSSHDMINRNRISIVTGMAGGGAG